MMDRERAATFEREVRENERKYRDEQRRADEEWRCEDSRWNRKWRIIELVVIGIAGLVLILAATIGSALIERGYLFP